MAGVAREGIRVRLDEGKLVLQGDGDRSYFTVVDLPLDADRDTLQYTYTNGVLDVVIARKRAFHCGLPFGQAGAGGRRFRPRTCANDDCNDSGGSTPACAR